MSYNEDPHYKETIKYTDEDGHEIEINEVVYDRTDGKGVDYVEQIKEDGQEIGHYTHHADGTNINTEFMLKTTKMKKKTTKMRKNLTTKMKKKIHYK